MNKILITGHTGFLGKHLCNEILTKFPNCQIIGVNCNLANPIELTKWEFENRNDLNDIQYFFHLAAYSDYGKFNEELQIFENPDYEDLFFLNQYINTNVLNLWSRSCPQAKMIAFGTSASYINSAPIEENYMKDECENNYSVHVMTKRMLLIGMKTLEKAKNLKWLYYVPSTLFGPEFKQGDGHLIPMLLNSLSKKSNIKCNGIEKNIIFVKDAVRMILKTINYENQIINLFSNDNYTMSGLSNIFKEILNLDFDIESNGLTSSSFKKPSEQFENFDFTPLEISLNETAIYSTDFLKF